WLERWIDATKARFPEAAPALPIPALHDRFRTTAAERTDFLATQTESSIERKITYTNIKGQTATYPLRAMLLHVCNHGSHHRAQAINILRRLGADYPKPGADYIFMKVEQQSSPSPSPNPMLDRQTISDYFAYADWAREKVHSAAEPLSDAQLDRPF